MYRRNKSMNDKTVSVLSERNEISDHGAALCPTGFAPTPYFAAATPALLCSTLRPGPVRQNIFRYQRKSAFHTRPQGRRARYERTNAPPKRPSETFVLTKRLVRKIIAYVTQYRIPLLNKTNVIMKGKAFYARQGKEGC